MCQLLRFDDPAPARYPTNMVSKRSTPKPHKSASPLTKGAGTRPRRERSVSPSRGGLSRPSANPSPLAKGGSTGGLFRPSATLDTRIIYCGDCLDQLRKLPDRCVDLIYIDPPFNSNRNYEVFWGETKEKRAFEDHRECTLRHNCPNTEERLLCQER